MSVILDALNKAQEERKKAAAAIPRHFAMPAPEKRTRYYIAIGAAVCFLALIFLVVPLFYKSKPAPSALAGKKTALPSPVVTSGPTVQPGNLQPPPSSVSSTMAGSSTPPPASRVPGPVREGRGQVGMIAEKNSSGKPEKLEKRDKADEPDRPPKRDKPERPQKSVSIASLPPQTIPSRGRPAVPPAAPLEADPLESRVVVKQVDDDRITTLYNLAVRETEKGNPASAEKLYKEILAERPSHVEALNNLGVMRMKEGNIRDAITYFRKCLIAKPDYEKACNNLGLALLNEGDTKQAEEYFRRSIRLDKNHVEPYLNLVSLLRSEKRFDEALKVLEDPLSLRMKEPALYLSFAIIKDEMADYREAIKYYRQYLASGGKREEKVIERLRVLEEDQSAKGR